MNIDNYEDNDNDNIIYSNIDTNFRYRAFGNNDNEDNFDINVKATINKQNGSIYS